MIWTYAFALAVIRMSKQGRWTGMHKLSLAAGVMTLFIFIDFMREFKNTAPDNPVGMSVVGLAAIAFLVWMGRRIKRSEKSTQPLTYKENEFAGC